MLILLLAMAIVLSIFSSEQNQREHNISNHDLLMHAILHGDVQAMTNIITLDRSLIENTIHELCTALFLAARWGKWRIIQKLLTMGARIDAVNERKQNILHFAAQSRSGKLITWLWNNVPDHLKDQTDSAGFTPLLEAACKMNIMAVMILLKLGANCNVSSGSGRTALHYLLSSGNLTVIKELWQRMSPEAREKRDKMGYCPLNRLAVVAQKQLPSNRFRIIAILKFLLARVAFVDARIFEYLSLETLLKIPQDKNDSADNQQIIDFDLIRLYIVRGAPLTPAVIKMYTSDQIELLWYYWCKTHRIPYKMLLYNVKEWRQEFLASVATTKGALSVDQQNALHIDEVINGDQKNAGIIPPMTLQPFPSAVIAIVIGYLTQTENRK